MPFRRTALTIVHYGRVWSPWCRKYPNARPVLFNFVYRPPGTKQSWIDTFDLLMEKFDMMNYEFHTLGDFNIHYYVDNAPQYSKNTKWNDMIMKYGLKQLINTPNKSSKTSFLYY